MAKIPQFAQDLTISACEYLESKGYKFELPQMEWRKSHREWLNFKTHKLVKGWTNSSGTCYKDHITITQGRDRVDCKMVILHELSHWVNPDDHHSDKFWDTAWDLYRHFKLPVRHCLNREKNYRKNSVKAYHRSK